MTTSTMTHDQIEKSHKELYDFLETQKSTDFTFVKDELIPKGLSLRVGDRIMEFKMTEVRSLPIDDLKAEMGKNFITKLDSIKKYLEKHLIESYQAIEVYKNEAEQKKLEYEKLMKVERPVPELSYNDIKKGLSVCKDDGKGLIWLYKGIYAPKYFFMANEKQTKYIAPKHFKELITPVLIQVRTSEDKVTSVSILDIFGNKFKHYHDTGSDDCWGDWRPSRETASTPSQIIEIANRALKILETVNEGSPGAREPRDLPKMATLKAGLVEKIDQEEYASKQSGIYKRLGLAKVDYKVLEVKRHQTSGWSV